LAQILLLQTSVETGLVAAPSPVHDVWLTISGDGHCLFIEDGHLVRFEGQGVLEFGTDRRRARPADNVTVYVDGEKVSGERAVRYSETVELRSGDSRWVIQSVIGQIPGRHGTHITDEDPDSAARIETDDPLAFFLRVTDSGGAEFFYPKMSS
jgi:hypothetical protein